MSTASAVLPSSHARKPGAAEQTSEGTALVAFVMVAATLLLLFRDGTLDAAFRSSIRASGIRALGLQLVNPAAPPVPSCPPHVLEAAREKRPVQDFRDCLLEHGKRLDEGAPDRHLRAAARSEGKERLNLLAEHVLDVWLWTLAQQAGTPCRPMIVRLECLKGQPCKGIGDRIKSLQSAFWMAVMTNSIFVHDIEVPVPLEEFFVPIRDEINFWEHRGCFGEQMRHNAKKWGPRTRGDTPGLLETFNVTRHWQNLDYVYMRPDLSFAAHILRTPHYQDTLERMQMQQLPLADFLYIANRIYLGQPSRRLQAIARPPMDELTAAGPATHKVGVHIRIGDSQISNAEKKGDLRYPVGATVCWVRQVAMQCHAVLPRPCACFLATDSDQVKELFTSNMSALGIPTVMVPGESAHIDFINGTDREATIVASQKTYLDWYLLTQMDGLTLSYSGYGLTAAWSTLAKTISYMSPMQRSREGDQQKPCVFEDFAHRCVGDSCPGQVTDPFPHWVTDAWTMGEISHRWR